MEVSTLYSDYIYISNYIWSHMLYLVSITNIFLEMNQLDSVSFTFIVFVHNCNINKLTEVLVYTK